MERFIALLEDSIKHLDDPVYPDGEESKLNRAEAEKADASKKTAAGLQSNSAEESPRVRHSLPLQAMASLLRLKLHRMQSFVQSLACASSPGDCGNSPAGRLPHDISGAAGLDVQEGG